MILKTGVSEVVNWSIKNSKYQINHKRPKYLNLHLTGKGKSISAITFYFLLCFISEVINSQDAARGKRAALWLRRLCTIMCFRFFWNLDFNISGGFSRTRVLTAEKSGVACFLIKKKFHFPRRVKILKNSGISHKNPKIPGFRIPENPLPLPPLVYIY